MKFVYSPFFLCTQCFTIPYCSLQVAARLREFKLHSLLIVGGFEAYHAVLQMYEARGKYPEFCIPMVVIPSTISNNVPGSDFSLGCDTALNEITEVGSL